MATATANLAKNPDGRGPSSAIPNNVVSTSPPVTYSERKNRRCTASETGDDDRANRNSAAEPDRERKHVHIAQREHTVIII